jgi:malate dehydrogenase (oxaloacetate-decarboxylating)
MNPVKEELARIINPGGSTGTLDQAIIGADVFVGVSKANVLSPKMVATMGQGAIVFALANPIPEILPDQALAAGAAVVATGRSDFPNQVNNVLVYPGLFRGLLDARASKLTNEMKLAAARALAGLITEPTAGMILPSITEVNPAPVIAAAISR